MKINKSTIDSLKKKLNINSDVHIIGIRGCLAAEYGKWINEVDVERAEIDHESMNCTFIIFNETNQMMFLNGSTSPHKRYLEIAKSKNGVGANQLECGLFKAYSKGLHYPSELTAHKALKQTRVAPLRRTADNISFDLNDRIEVAVVGDNIHAAWCNIGGKTHASAGCQVIAGYPDCKKRKGNTSHWKLFYDHIYSLPQQEFNYLLVNYSWVERTSNNNMNELIIFGSEGEKVKQLQRALNIKDDGVYLKQSYQKILDFQKDKNLTVDGIVGNQTLKMLGIIK